MAMFVTRLLNLSIFSSKANYGRSLLMVMLIFSNLPAIVIETSSWERIEKELQNLDKDALVAFDVDYTLIVPNDKILAPCGESYFLAFMKKLRAMGKQGSLLGSKIALQGKVSIVDKKIFSVLDFLRKKQINTLALTAMPTGEFGVIPEAEEWRINQLHALGIDLDWSLPTPLRIQLEVGEENKKLAGFKKGVLATGKSSKGEALIALLNYFYLKPSQVIFVDDKMEYISSVEDELEKKKIPHTSFYYTGAIGTPCQLDEKIADIQFNYLLEKGEWLSDEEAIHEQLNSTDARNAPPIDKHFFSDSY